MTEIENELNAVDKNQIYEYLAQSQMSPTPEEKHNIHSFLNNVATATDTTKTGFLTEDEVGTPRYSLRSLKEFAQIADKIMGNEYIKEFFLSEAENVTATSLSREGFLIKQATTQTKRIADVTKPKKPNKSWFKSKKDEDEENKPEQ